MLQPFMKTFLGLVALVVCTFMASFDAEAQGLLSFSGQLKANLPQSRLLEPVAAVPRTCTSISSKSRRCHFTFAAECKKRGESAAHCTRMSGFCHACTDAYATCKGEQNRAAEKSSGGMDCSRCNIAYSRCISRMVEQYGGKLVKPK